MAKDSEDESALKVVSFRLTPYDQDLVNKRAKKLGISASGLIRRLIRQQPDPENRRVFLREKCYKCSGSGLIGTGDRERACPDCRGFGEILIEA